jgi:hypothetical protein
MPQERVSFKACQRKAEMALLAISGKKALCMAAVPAISNLF